MNRLFEHGEILIVQDKNSPYHRKSGKVWVTTQDSSRDRNPENKVMYTIAIVGKGMLSFFEDQLSRSTS
jgi:hypothetical protein